MPSHHTVGNTLKYYNDNNNFNFAHSCLSFYDSLTAERTHCMFIFLHSCLLFTFFQILSWRDKYFKLRWSEVRDWILLICHKLHLTHCCGLLMSLYRKRCRTYRMPVTTSWCWTTRPCWSLIKSVMSLSVTRRKKHKTCWRRQRWVLTIMAR